MISKQTGHSKSAASSSVRVAPAAGNTAGSWLLLEVEVEAPDESPLPPTPRRFTICGWAIWGDGINEIRIQIYSTAQTLHVISTKH